MKWTLLEELKRGLRMEEEVFWDVMEEFATSAGKDIKDMQQI